MEQGLCYRLAAGGVCSFPLSHHITQQICCCSRVGKGWGKNCEECPMPGSGETCLLWLCLLWLDWGLGLPELAATQTTAGCRVERCKCWPVGWVQQPREQTLIILGRKGKP